MEMHWFSLRNLLNFSSWKGFVLEELTGSFGNGS
jgi:hypothetical protein